MAITMNKTYYIVSHAGTGKYLNVYGDESISNSTNVILWDQSVGSGAQGWRPKSLSGGTKILSALNLDYSLDFWRGSSIYGNCDVYSEAGNDVDQTVLLEAVNASNNIYKIKLKNHSDGRYLTAKGTSNGSNVNWETSATGTTQQWKFIEWPAPSKLNYTIPNFPSIYNQKWTGMDDSWIRDFGCALCCAACVATFYKGSEVSPKTLPYDSERGISWGSMPNAYYTDAVPSLITLRAQIALNKPVVIHVNGPRYEHWVVAYGYEGDGASYSLIKVKDSAGEIGSTQYGVNRSLPEAMEHSYCNSVIGFKLTSKKS